MNGGTRTAAAKDSTTEGSLIGRFVALLSPVFVIAAGWLAGIVGKAVPGAIGETVVPIIASASATPKTSTTGSTP